MRLGVLRYKIWRDLWTNKARTLQIVAIIAVGSLPCRSASPLPWPLSAFFRLSLERRCHFGTPQGVL